jgi:hypothetical protein
MPKYYEFKVCGYYLYYTATDETCGSGGFMAWVKNNSEVIWSE